MANMRLGNGETDTDHVAHNIFAFGNWFPIHRSFIKAFGFEKAVFIHYLIDLASQLLKNGKCKGHWFFCTTERLERELYISWEVQNRLIRSLVEIGVIETKQMGMPAKRYLKVNTEKLMSVLLSFTDQQDTVSGAQPKQESVAQPKQESVAPRKQESGARRKPFLIYTNTKVSINKTKQTRGRTKSSPPGLFETSWDQKQGAILRSILISHDSDLTNPPRVVRVSTLAKSITKLRTERKVTKLAISVMLAWLEEHYDSPFVPKLHAADDLFTKWERFRHAKSVWDKKHQTKDEKTASSNKAVGKIRSWLRKNKGWDIDQPTDESEFEEALEALGLEDCGVDIEAI